MFIKRMINREYVKRLVQDILDEKMKDIADREQELDQKSIKLEIERKKIVASNITGLRTPLEIADKLKELEEEMHNHLRASSKEGDIDYVRSKQVEYTINFINTWLKK